MITLELAPKQQALIEKASQQAGMSVEEYIISKVLPDASNPFKNNVYQLKGMVKSNLSLSIDEMNATIAKAGTDNAN